MEIAHANVLAIIAEVAAAFVGFSLAIGLLQPNQPDARLRRQAMHSVAELAMVAGAGALIILVVNTYGMTPEYSWRIGSALTAVLWGGTFCWAVIRYGQAGYTVVTDRNVRFAAFLSLVGIALFVGNAIFTLKAAGAIHVTGLFIALVDAGYLFLLSTFLIDVDENSS